MGIDEARERLDRIDDEMVELFLERMGIADNVARYKVENGKPLTDPAREREILARVTEASGDMEAYTHRLYTTLFQLSKSRQSRLMSDGESPVRQQVERGLARGGDVFPRSGMIAVQGNEGAYSQMAAEKILPRGNIVFVKSFEAVFDAVSSGLCTFGILPVENSSAGSVRKVYDLLQKREFSIVRSTRVYIRHELLAKPGTKLEDIREIHSHEQAIGQCSKFLAGLENVKVVSVDNTATAAKAISESDDPSIAAIASHSAAELYGLEVLSSDIQDSDNNYTRFICITKEPTIYAGANHISLVIDTANTPGALYDVLSDIAALGVNMSKLESVPVSGSNFEFIFFIDLEASVQEPGVMELLENLERTSELFLMLGNYQEV